MLLVPSIALPLGLAVYAALVAVTATLFALMLTANRFVKRRTPLGPFLLDFAVVVLLVIYISWANFRSVPATLMGRHRIFVRTPKEGSTLSPGR